MENEKTLFIGKFIQVRLVEGKPFFMTLFCSPSLNFHLTSNLRADEILQMEEEKINTLLGLKLKQKKSHLLNPPSFTTMSQLGPWEETEFMIRGKGWRETGEDIVIGGLGWIGVTGSGSCKIKITVPEGVLVDRREPLMPFDHIQHMAKFTGGKVVYYPTSQNGKKKKRKKRRKPIS